MTQFVGPNTVEQMIILEHTTPSGQEIVKVVYDGEVEDEMMSLKMFEAVVTEEVSDLTELREAMVNPVAEDIIKVMADWGVRMIDLQYLIQQKVVKSVEDRIDVAHSKLIRSKLDVASDLKDVTLLHYDIVLEEKND